MSLVGAIALSLRGRQKQRSAVAGIRKRKRNHPLGFGLLLVFPEGGNDDVRVAGICAVDRLAVVAESLLGEALGIPGGLGALRPGVAVGVQGHPGDLETPATLLELGLAVSSRFAWIRVWPAIRNPVNP